MLLEAFTVLECGPESLIFVFVGLCTSRRARVTIQDLGPKNGNSANPCSWAEVQMCCVDVKVNQT